MKEKPITECVYKRIMLCGEARRNVLHLKARLMLDGKNYTQEQVINKMLREFK